MHNAARALASSLRFGAVIAMGLSLVCGAARFSHAQGPAGAPRSPSGKDSGPPARSVETLCNGVDDDGDGLTDVLLPVSENACSTGKRGACATGFAACERGVRVCLGAAPVPEVRDGIDNDCNGVVDDVQVRRVKARALVIAPRYAWTEAGTDIATLSASLAQAGIPFDRQPAGSDWTPTLAGIDDYALVVLPGYLNPASVSTDVKEKLEAFARSGGVVVVFKPLGVKDRAQALKLTGLKSSTRHRDALEVRFDGAAAALVSELDSPEERSLHINPNRPLPPPAAPVELYTFEPEDGTEVLANGYAGERALGAAVTRRPLDRGAIYAIGHDFSTYAGTPCYTNCFTPGGDILRLVLRGALREGTSGHLALVHTAPNAAPAVAILTHDIDSAEAWKTGKWGDPGALQVSAVEQLRGVRATFFAAAGSRGGNYDGNTARELCARGMCPLGAHGVEQLRSFGTLPEGSCTETAENYRSPSLCGEIRVSTETLRGLTNQAPRAWRSPFLAVHPQQFTRLVKSGISFDSGFAVGDVPYNLPIDLASVGFLQNRFKHAPMIEFPVACEDESDVFDGPKKSRLTLDGGTRAQFENAWEYVFLRNLQNASFTVLSMRPWRAASPSPDSLSHKLTALDRYLQMVKNHEAVVMPIEEAGDFWRARLGMSLEAVYDDASGYTGSVSIGTTTAAGLTLEFGDRITKFTCDACGATKIVGKRVVLLNTPAPGTKASFVAAVR